VLDPACGSGIFLVEALRKIIEKYIEVTGSSKNTAKFREALRRLAADNIFGIDEDESAVQVAIFSVYLTMLDYLQPADIAVFKFPNLLNTNFFNSDFFKMDAPFNSILSKDKMKFDFIIGNPPWKRGE
jgi:type I restriction-modification system DNA methylase subunit